MNHKVIMLLALVSVPALHGMERTFMLGERMRMFLAEHPIASVCAHACAGLVARLAYSKVTGRHDTKLVTTAEK